MTKSQTIYNDSTGTKVVPLSEPAYWAIVGKDISEFNYVGSREFFKGELIKIVPQNFKEGIPCLFSINRYVVNILNRYALALDDYYAIIQLSPFKPCDI